MADIRIKDLAVTAGSSASDDYLAVDGSTNGTRKLSAYSPTFGGNLTVSGKIVSSQDVQLGNTYTLTWGGAYGAGIPSIAGSTGAGNVQIYPTGSTSGATATFTASATTLAGNLTVSGTGTSTFGGTVRAGAGSGETLGAGSVDVAADLGIKSTQGIVQGGARIVAFANGNTLLGTGTDSANGKLQLATHTTSAGGIGFGTDVSLYRQDENTLVVQPTGSSKKVLFYGDSTVSGLFNSLSSYEAIYFDPSAHSIKLATNGFTALTLDSSQNATFAGNITRTRSAAGSTGSAVTDYLVRLGNSTSSSAAGVLASNIGASNFRTSLVLRTTDSSGNAVDAATFDYAGDATFAGSIAIGNTVNTVSPTSPNRTITMVIGGTTYYIHAKTTND